MRYAIRALRQCNTAITWIVKVVVMVISSAMVATICWQVAMRYVFNLPPSWTEELALLLFSWAMLLMLALGVREAFHVRVDILIERVPAVLRQVIEVFTCTATLAFGLFLASSGVDYVEEMRGSISAAIGYPIELLYSAAPVCGGLIALYSLERLLSSFDSGGRS
ncbi:TRAP transporter small permease [Bordetella petrii]|uniref:TRAP transporter small permease n=1 Tax=Bordetella petrii TaxID=94624 RepID=UPI001E4CAE91|nr:TRAP transporter small permease [Bordetella petrii]MCD0502301.1 TRAP transporter small permease [Bordetella petrii]